MSDSWTFWFLSAIWSLQQLSPCVPVPVMWMWYSSLKILLQTGSLTFTWFVDIPGRFISRSPMKWGNSQSWNTHMVSLACDCDNVASAVEKWTHLNNHIRPDKCPPCIVLYCMLNTSLNFLILADIKSLWSLTVHWLQVKHVESCCRLWTTLCLQACWVY